MDAESRRLVEDCFLRPISNAKATNSVAESSTPPAKPLKTELQVVRLNEQSQRMTMQTLCHIHGEDFQLSDATKYKDKGSQLKKHYWQDRGTLVVHSIENYADPAYKGPNGITSNSDTEDRLQRYALDKLQSYGYPKTHCLEAYKHCEGDTDAALLLLFKKYMCEERKNDAGAECNANQLAQLSEKELKELREDEKAALQSIYDKNYEEKQHEQIWSLKFDVAQLQKLLSPEQQKQVEVQAAEKAKAQEKPKTKDKPRCRYFDKAGKCRFGPKCRFAHLPPVKDEKENKPKSTYLDENENEEQKHCYLEVRFPPQTKYPYEAPYIYLKTQSHDVPHVALLRLTRSLYKQACELSRDGMPCVYSLSEMLLLDGSGLQQDETPLPDPRKSLFHAENAQAALEAGNGAQELLPSHYERGQTSQSGGVKRKAEELEREDRQLSRKFMQLQDDERYFKMLSTRRKLPAFQKMPQILEQIEKSQVLVISGETGCGKSTQVPQFIMDDWLFRGSKLSSNEKMPHVELVCTQPRRLSAIGVAQRVADERADRIGQLVGYQIRLENKISQSTRLTFCTTGILLRRLASDPLLENLTHIIVDEVHERSEESDFLLMLLKGILKQRKDLKVILMSATLNATLFSDYFGGAPVLDIPGRTFPVEQYFLEDILEMCDYVVEPDSQYSRKIQKKEEEEVMRELEYADVRASSAMPPNKFKDEQLTLSAVYARYGDYSKKTCKSIYLLEPMQINPELIESVLTYIVAGEHKWPRTGTILIFLPGLQEIHAVHDALCDSSIFGPRGSKFLLVPLHSTLSSEEQAAIFRPAPSGKRKIVLSTNIAETSVTIDDCVFVIDTGLMKEKSFDTNRNMESLDLVWVSRANAKQRMGRAGRVMPGVCIHLYTGHRYEHNILAQPVPEIHRVPLEQLLLRIKTLPYFENKNVIEVLGQTLDPPTEHSIVSAVRRLQDVDAFDAQQNLTPLGHHLSALPVDVRIGKLMMYGAIFQCLDSVLTIAACLSNKSPFVTPFNKRLQANGCKRSFATNNSDHITVLNAYRKWLDVHKRNRQAGRSYADENFLSLKVLQTICEMKYQFLELLVSIGFVPINVPRKPKNYEDNILDLTGQELNSNGANNRLIASLLCAALYPNIVKILTPARTYIQTASGAMSKPLEPKDLRFKTHADGFVALHPSSVNAQVASFSSPFLVYQEKVKTSRVYIRECSMLPLVPLVLFAGCDLKIELQGGDFVFLLEDGWIVLKAANHRVAEMIQCLRLELHKILEEKIRDPCLNLLHHEHGNLIIKNIVHLITHNN